MVPDRFPTLHGWSWSGDDAGAAAHLEQLDAWRAGWVRWIATDPGARISPPLRDILVQVLGDAPLTTANALPYRLRPYPITGSRTVEQVVMWRAGVVDFLNDAWDTIGGGFDVEECGRLAARLMPEAAGSATCSLCLVAISPEAQRTHFDDCAVQNRWRIEHEQA